jgi:hypothetical protein
LPPALLYLVGYLDTQPSLLFLSIHLLVIVTASFGIYFLNKRAVNKNFKPLVKDIDKTLESLNNNTPNYET